MEDRSAIQRDDASGRGRPEHQNLLILAESNSSAACLAKQYGVQFCLRPQDIVIAPGFVFNNRVYSYRIRQPGKPDRETWVWPPVVPETYRNSDLNKILSKYQSKIRFSTALILLSVKPGVPIGTVHHLGSLINDVVVNPWTLVAELDQMRSIGAEGWKPLRNLTSELMQLYPTTPAPAGLLSRSAVKTLFPGLFEPSRRSSERDDWLLLRRELDLKSRPEYLPISFQDSVKSRPHHFLSQLARLYAYARYRLQTRIND